MPVCQSASGMSRIGGLSSDLLTKKVFKPSEGPLHHFSRRSRSYVFQRRHDFVFLLSRHIVVGLGHRFSSYWLASRYSIKPVRWSLQDLAQMREGKAVSQVILHY